MSGLGPHFPWRRAPQLNQLSTQGPGWAESECREGLVRGLRPAGLRLPRRLLSLPSPSAWWPRCPPSHLQGARSRRGPACVCVKCARLPEREGVCLECGESRFGPASLFAHALSAARSARRLRARERARRAWSAKGGCLRPLGAG